MDQYVWTKDVFAIYISTFYILFSDSHCFLQHTLNDSIYYIIAPTMMNMLYVILIVYLIFDCSATSQKDRCFSYLISTNFDLKITPILSSWPYYCQFFILSQVKLKIIFLKLLVSLLIFFFRRIKPIKPPFI